MKPLSTSFKPHLQSITCIKRASFIGISSPKTYSSIARAMLSYAISAGRPIPCLRGRHFVAHSITCLRKCSTIGRMTIESIYGLWESYSSNCSMAMLHSQPISTLPRKSRSKASWMPEQLPLRLGQAYRRIPKTWSHSWSRPTPPSEPPWTKYLIIPGSQGKRKPSV